MERSLITDLPRDKYVERYKQRAFDYLDQGDLKKAAALFVRDMNAVPIANRHTIGGARRFAADGGGCVRLEGAYRRIEVIIFRIDGPV